MQVCRCKHGRRLEPSNPVAVGGAETKQQTALTAEDASHKLSAKPPSEALRFLVSCAPAPMPREVERHVLVSPEATRRAAERGSQGERATSLCVTF